MNNSLWPFRLNGQLFDEPQSNGNKYTINNVDLVSVVQNHPKVFQHIIENKIHLSTEFNEYIENISVPFEQLIPYGALCKIKLPQTEWQQQQEHKYAKMELIHCANYNNYLLPFHDPENQYCLFFVNIDASVNRDEIQLYWERETKPDGSYEEHMWTSADNVEIIYSPTVNDDDKDRQIGMKNLFLKYFKCLSNERLDEIEESGEELFQILLCRLRGKCRIGKHSKILSVQTTVSASISDILEDMISNISDEDTDFSSKHNCTSYKLTRSQLFGGLKVNPELVTRIFNEFKMEMKLRRSISECALFVSVSNGYNASLKELTSSIIKKHSKKNKIPSVVIAFNGLRITFKKNNIKLTTNSFKSTFDSKRIDDARKKYPITETIGRRSGW